ncbi:hypothetical protein [Streptomyces sp. OK228]|uniref:hypothetical protein n=1 Tax=Streptomyces sp. OK228 TaxID=1882786 RepID=UPI000BD296F0|nr:hypothetical protein [Streptomyces sp. OK228]SOE31716.1 hypothetical protein SAMN05442782_8646 [Streptomyces sp. OK228]
MAATDCVGFLDADLPPVPPPTPRAPAALTELIAGTLWPLADWKGNRAQCERAAQAVARLIVSTNSTAALHRAANEEAQRLAAELVGARATIDHMRGAMSWLSGHDRQGLDHLAEANYEARAREAAVAQARQWAERARTTESAVGRVTAWCNDLDHRAKEQAGPDAVHPVAAHVRHHLAGATGEGPK